MDRQILFLLFSIFMLAGCQVTGTQDIQAPVSVTPSADSIDIDDRPASQTVNPEVTPSISNQNEMMPNLETHPHVLKAKDNLATQTNVPIDQIEIVNVQSMTWPDTSMGCPQPDMVYLQVQKDGLLIQLRAGGMIYNYHSGGNLDPFLCVPTKSGSKEPKLELPMTRPPLSDDFDK